ncbi:MAG: hypothetical protein ABIO83_07560 [Ilumatobacteraceae bacterium]
MGILIAVIVVVAVLAIAAGTVLVTRRRRAVAVARDADSAPERVTRGVVAPMTGLESALAHVTDRSGRPIGERIDAESQHVDELRVPDDTGPVLRRALDSVAPTSAPTPPADRPSTIGPGADGSTTPPS